MRQLSKTTMSNRPTARFALRAATAGDHDLIDGLYSRFDLAQAAHYRAFLSAQADAFIPVEAAIDRVDLTGLLDDWQQRRRSAELTADLLDLGTQPEPATDIPVYSRAEALGAIYVLEGSRLGGRVLARSVPAGLPRRFLGAGEPSLWRVLIEVLDKNLVTEEQLSAATGAARAVFARFGACARIYQEDLSR